MSSSFLTQTISAKSTLHSFVQDPQRKFIQYKLAGIFEKIQSPTTEKTALTTYKDFLNEFDLYDSSNKTPFYILKHISSFVSSLPLDNKKQALKLFSSFFLVFPSLAAPPLVSYLDYILKCLQSHLNNKTSRILANCFEDIVKNLNSLSTGKPVSIINNMLYNYSTENSNIKYGMMCLKKLIENSSIISSDGYYENIINNIFFDLYNSEEFLEEDETKCEMLNCVIRIILLKENHYKKFAKQTLETIYLDMIHVNSILQKKVLNVIYLLVLYCAGSILPFENEVSSMIRNLKMNKDKHVRENAVLILQLYNDILDNFSNMNNGDSTIRNDKKKGLKRSNSQEQIVLNKKNDDLHISRSYGVKPQMKKNGDNKRNSLERCKSHSNLFSNSNTTGLNNSNNKLKASKVNTSKNIKCINTNNSKTAPNGFYANYFKRGSSTSKSMSGSGFKLNNKKSPLNQRNASVNKRRENQRKLQNDESNGKLSLSDLKVCSKEFIPSKSDNNTMKPKNSQNNHDIIDYNYKENKDNTNNNKQDVKEFNELANVSKQMEEISDRMDLLLKSMNKLQNDTTLQISDLNSRVKTMETAINSISPASNPNKIINQSQEFQQIHSPIQSSQQLNKEYLMQSMQSPIQSSQQLNKEQLMQSMQSPVQRYQQSNEEHTLYSPTQRYMQSYEQHFSPSQRYYEPNEVPLIPSPINKNFHQPITQTLKDNSTPIQFESHSTKQQQFEPEQSQQFLSTYNRETSPYQLQLMTPENPLEEEIIYTLQSQNEEALLNIISIISIDNLKSLKSGLIDEIIVALLGIAIRGKQIHAIVTFIQICLTSVKQYIKIPTISTIKDIFNYIVNDKFANLSRSDVMDINTILSEI